MAEEFTSRDAPPAMFDNFTTSLCLSVLLVPKWRWGKEKEDGQEVVVTERVNDRERERERSHFL